MFHGKGVIMAWYEVAGMWKDALDGGRLFHGCGTAVLMSAVQAVEVNQLFNNLFM